jgi:hypothetical protein
MAYSLGRGKAYGGFNLNADVVMKSPGIPEVPPKRLIEKGFL